jgi:hypothetical protein
VSEVVLANARVVMSDEVLQGAVTIAGGRIVDVAPARATASAAVDLEGDYLIRVLSSSTPTCSRSTRFRAPARAGRKWLRSSPTTRS